MLGIGWQGKLTLYLYKLARTMGLSFEAARSGLCLILVGFPPIPLVVVLGCLRIDEVGCLKLLDMQDMESVACSCTIEEICLLRR